MKEKEKQIEEMRIQRKLEMTKDISNGICGVLAYEIQKLAEHLISLNYVKLSKDSVVLSSEERQTRDYECQNIGYEIGKKEGSKETAEKIYQQLKEHGTTYVKKWIEKEFGVEINECKINKKLLERVKKGLDCCSVYPHECNKCAYLDEVGGSCNYLIVDAKQIIQELECELGNYISDQGILLQEMESLRTELKNIQNN